MKKLAILILALALMLSLAACGGTGGTSSNASNPPASTTGNNPSTSAPDNSTASPNNATSSPSSTDTANNGKTAAFFDMFASGTWHMKYQVTTGGQTTELEAYMKGGMTAMNMGSGDTAVRIIARDGKSYMIMDASKTYTVSDISDKSNGPVVTDGMKMTGSGTATFNGKSLPYEEYTDPSGDKAQYFMDGNKLAGIRSTSGGTNTDVVITVLDQNVPGGVFDIPSGYTQMGQ